jgi:hypothetical protein
MIQRKLPGIKGRDLFIKKGKKMKVIQLIISVLLVTLNGLLFAQNNVTPQTLTPLAVTVNESSGLINLDGKIWTHNDSGGQPSLYEISKMDGSVLRTVLIQNATNIDWEDLAADSEYVYIGDFGNNSGSRTDLKIYRISRSDLAFNNSVPAETINFSFSDQTSWDPHPNQTDFDCEGFIAFQDSLYLFSKDWVDHKTRMYQLSNQPGTHVALYQSTFDVLGMITAAELFSPNMLVLQGYTSTLTPFTWLFQQFTGTNFFQGTSDKLTWTNKAQTEGIAYADSNGVYVTSEKAPVPLPYVATLFYLDISGYILDPPPSGIPTIDPHLKVFGNHFTVTVSSENEDLILGTVSITNVVGKILKEINQILGSHITIPVTLESGIYFVTVKTDKGTFSRKILIQ